MRLSEHIYRTISSIRGPLLQAERISAARIGEWCASAFLVERRQKGKYSRSTGDRAGPGFRGNARIGSGCKAGIHRRG